MNRHPAPESSQELARFAELQQRLSPLFQRVFPDRLAPRTVVVVPSLSLDVQLLAKIVGVRHYEERFLCMLMLLRLPRTRVVYITSTAIDPTIIDYYLSLLPGIPASHARRRLVLIHCGDETSDNLTRKILRRPRLVERIRAAIAEPEFAHMTCFNAEAEERTLAVRLGIPLFACDPALSDLGSKSGSREIFREAGIDLPAGMERLRDERDIVESLTELKRSQPELMRAAVKLEEGTSGEGNAVFPYAGCPDSSGLSSWIRGELADRLVLEASGESFEAFRDRFIQMGGVVEAWIDAADKRSPSMQGRVNPLGDVELISTHDQVLGGPSGQVFLGCSFPASAEYRLQIQDAGARVGRVLRDRSALGRFGVDFVSVQREDGGWKHYAIEINLRKGGTTHTYRTLQFLTDGRYDEKTGLFYTPAGQPRFYHASDNIQSDAYRQLTPEDLINLVVEHGLHFHESCQQGVVFHLLGALSSYGKLGMVAVGDSLDQARQLYRDTVAILDRECSAPG